MEKIVSMTEKEFKLAKSSARLAGRLDVLEKLTSNHDKGVRQLYLEHLKNEIGLAVFDVQEATSEYTLRLAIDGLLEQLYKIGLADK